MSKIKRIGEDNYIKEEYTHQDELNEDNQKIINLLKNYVKVPQELCDNLVLGSKIKYITNEGMFRYGGVLIKNGFPDYIVLLNPFKKITWSVNLKKNNIFMEDLRKIQKEKQEKDNLYKLYNAGMLRIKDEDEDENESDEEN